MICNICGNETTEAGNAFIALPFGVICEECANEIESSKEKDTMKTCLICFSDYLEENTKDHQCPEFWCCGACGESCGIEDGTIVLHKGFQEFTHKAELCPAQDEIEEAK